MNNSKRVGRLPLKYRKRVEGQLQILSEKIQAQREKAGYTQEELAEHLGISSMTVQFIEQRRRYPSLPMLFYICDYLGIKITFS